MTDPDQGVPSRGSRPSSPLNRIREIVARRPLAIILVTFVVGLSAGLAAGLSLDNRNPSAEPGDAEVVDVRDPVRVTPRPAREVAAYVPKPEDFRLEPLVVESRCFGSAGCNVTFRIELEYQGGALEPGSEWEVIYEVRGGEDPYRNSLTVRPSGRDSVVSEVDREEFLSTASADAVLEVVVIEVVNLR